MEVRIKSNNKLIDATIEMIDGVMVVSPKIEKWQPENGETYWYPYLNERSSMGFCSEASQVWGKEIEDVDTPLYEKGWCFKTEEECKDFCNRLNDAISQVKP